MNLPGKTTLSLHVIAEAQKLGGVCAFIDAEHAMDPEYSKRLGVKIDELLVSQPGQWRTSWREMVNKRLGPEKLT